MGKAEHVCVTGPLAPYAASFREELSNPGDAPGSVRNYVIVARSFLSHRFEATGGTLALETLNTEDVTQFVLGECQRCSVGSAKCMVTRLRCLLRFFFAEGLTQRALAPAVPSVA